MQRAHQGLPGRVIGQLGRPGNEPVARPQLLDLAQEDGAEHACQRAVGEQEVLRRLDEGTAVALERPAGDQAVHMRVQLQGLAPGVQHHDDAEIAAPAVAGEGL